MKTSASTTVAIVIPIYKETLTEYEYISLSQCHKILGNYKIIYVMPEGLDISAYHAISGNYETIPFPKKFFESISGYNQLMLSSAFYRAFRNFTYILIHQLDAFVFSDQLEDWCSQGYDYIGAPWPSLAEPHKTEVLCRVPFWVRYSKLRKLFGIKTRLVGNGGFSLRKVSSHLKVSTISKLIGCTPAVNEDTFWSLLVPCYFPFKIPDPDIARLFAIELLPEYYYELNGQLLPFGCHGWDKHGLEFWRPFFADIGYVI